MNTLKNRHVVTFPTLTPKERKTVRAIVKRWLAMYKRWGIAPPDALSVEMDLYATHGDCGLKFAALLAADDFNFVHDLGGIRAHMNRRTGKLDNHFLPRFSGGVQ